MLETPTKRHGAATFKPPVISPVGLNIFSYIISHSRGGGWIYRIYRLHIQTCRAILCNVDICLLTKLVKPRNRHQQVCAGEPIHPFCILETSSKHLFYILRMCGIFHRVGNCNYIRGLCYQKQVSQVGISNGIPQYYVGCNYLFLPEIPASDNKVHIW